ncbi:MAG: hypothetical protein A3H73_03255 [Candidatus Taylorbacteria bacterium RIFCSPLOWO2_02_FULL_50_120]|nr:MAG: hypothetical protein A3H73_03255 [Candidatus Taylorbacteria bacterium RIFCSPLOWO2_02_FULL_50_120]
MTRAPKNNALGSASKTRQNSEQKGPEKMKVFVFQDIDIVAVVLLKLNDKTNRRGVVARFVLKDDPKISNWPF